MNNYNIRNRYLLIADLLLCVLAYIVAFLLVCPIRSVLLYLIPGLPLILATSVIYVVMLFLMGIYRTDWIYADSKDYAKLISACIFGLTCSIICSIMLGFLDIKIIYPKLNIAANVFACCFLCGLRFFIRLTYKYTRSPDTSHGKRALIIGAGKLAVSLLRDIDENENLDYNVIGLIDDDRLKYKNRIHGVDVLGNRNDIEKICNDKKISEIIFAIHNIPEKEKADILDHCSNTNCKVKIIAGFEASLNGKIQSSSIRNVEIEDLLERDSIVLDNKLISEDIYSKTILVTGGGGSIGSELCRQIIKYKPETLIILDIYENTTYELQNELEELYPEQKLEVLIASVRDEKRLNEIFQMYHPDIVFHAAAHKHVPLMEFSPCEAIKNNVFGTYNVAKCAANHGVGRFVMISTDKAVNPTNIMGATKRMCEMIIQTLSRTEKTEFVAVRFGNVLGSNGSVIPRFKKQIEKGGPVTVTHPDITRFFMTIPEAAQLVLQAAAYARGGEIFVLDMGKPVKIYDLAKKIIRLSGYTPDVDIKIEFTGLRAGEKLYEELLMNEEGLKKTSHSKIFVGQPISITPAELDEKLSLLKAAVEDGSVDVIKQTMSTVVPTYVYKNKTEQKEFAAN